jgi:hypothetical protein
MIHYNTPSLRHHRHIIHYTTRSQHLLPIIRSLRRHHLRPTITITAARCIRTKSTFLVIAARLPGLLPNQLLGLQLSGS